MIAPWLRTSWRFWSATPLRSALLLASLALVTALAASLLPLAQQSVLYRPPEVRVEGAFLTLGTRSAEGRFQPATLADFDSLKGSHLQDRVALYGVESLDAALADGPLPVSAALVSANFFSLLGMRARLGTMPQDFDDGVVLTEEFWRQHFAQDGEAIGQTIRLGDGHMLRVVAVVEGPVSGFGGGSPELFLPVALYPQFASRPLGLTGMSEALVERFHRQLLAYSPRFTGLAVLNSARDVPALTEAWRPGSPPVIAFDFGGSTKTYLKTGSGGTRPAVAPGLDLDSDRTALIRSYLVLFVAIFAVVAVIVTANLVAHLLASLPARAQEMRIRVALGADIGRLLLEFLQEQLPFALLSLILAVPMARGFLAVLVATEPFSSYFLERPPGLGVAGLALAAATLAVVLLICALVPLPKVRALALGQQGLSESAAARALRTTLSALQWSLAFVVLAVAALTWINAERSKQVPWGGKGDPYIVSVAKEMQTQLGAEWRTHASADIAFATRAPLYGLDRMEQFVLPGSGREDALAAYTNAVSSDFFDALGVPLLAGEPLDPRTISRVVVSASVAKLLGVAPSALIGQALVEDMGSSPIRRNYVIGGVVGDLRYDRLYGDPEPLIYFAAEAQSNPVLFYALGKNQRDLSDLGVSPRPLSRKLYKRTLLERRITLGITALALLAFALMVIGLIAETWFTLSARARELALRMCLGAEPIRLGAELLRSRLPMALLGWGVALVFSRYVIAAWSQRLPLLKAADATWVSGLALLVLLLVMASLALAIGRLLRPDLSQLLREER